MYAELVEVLPKLISGTDSLMAALSEFMTAVDLEEVSFCLWTEIGEYRISVNGDRQVTISPIANKEAV